MSGEHAYDRDVPSLREQFEREGYLVLRGLFDPDALAQAQEETQALLARQELMARNNIRVRWTHHVDTDAPIFELFDPIVDIAPRCRELALAPRLTAALAELLGDEVCLFKDKLIYKPSGASGYPLHQDHIAWLDFPVSFTTVVVALDRGDAQSGAIEVFPGAHCKGYLSERDGNFHMLEVSELPNREPVQPVLEPGDALIFGGFMPHRSGVNHSPHQRRHLLFSYNARAEGGDQRAEHYQVFHHYLRSVYGAMGLGDLYFR